MKVRYIGERPRIVAPVDSPAFDVAPGDVVDVSAALAESLLEQTELWERPPAPRKQEA